jgi:hypothetical protein
MKSLPLILQQKATFFPLVCRPSAILIMDGIMDVIALRAVGVASPECSFRAKQSFSIV